MSAPAKHLGSVTTYLRKVRQNTSGVANVQCGSCNGCCRVPILVDLAADELPSFPDAVPTEREGRKVWSLPRAPTGECTYLVVGGRCSIYDRRPRSCRSFDCRILAFIGVRTDSPIMDEALAQWAPPRTDQPDDRRTLAALRAAWFAGGPPRNVSEGIVKALATYTRFGGVVA